MYIRKLVAAGHKVGIVAQVDTVAGKKINSDPSKEILTRKLTGIYTATTMIGSDLKLIDDETQRGRDTKGIFSTELVLALHENEKGLIAMVGIQPMSGDVIYDHYDISKTHFNELEHRLVILQPREIIIPESNGKLISFKSREIIKAYINERKANMPARLELLPNEAFEDISAELVGTVLEPGNKSYLTIIWPNLSISLTQCFSALFVYLKGALNQYYARYYLSFLYLNSVIPSFFEIYKAETRNRKSTITS